MKWAQMKWGWEKEMMKWRNCGDLFRQKSDCKWSCKPRAQECEMNAQVKLFCWQDPENWEQTFWIWHIQDFGYYINRVSLRWAIKKCIEGNKEENTPWITARKINTIMEPMRKSFYARYHSIIIFFSFMLWEYICQVFEMLCYVSRLQNA